MEIDIPITLYKQDWINPKLFIRESSFSGLGIFSKNIIKKGEDLVVFGAKYTNKQGSILARIHGFYVMELDEDLFSFELPGENKSWSINHSCDPNSGMKDPFTLVSMSKIEINSEITIDYVMWDDEYSERFSCNCGSALCRKVITPYDWKLSKLQQKYSGYFLPFLDKKINISKT